MSRSYKVTGINLKAIPLGENDRLLTILTPERGVVRAVAAGARKHKSQFSGRSRLFVINQLVVASGRSLDRITQAETLESFPGLGQNLQRLTAGQYLAELSLFQALDHHPQADLFYLLQEHLHRLNGAEPEEVLPRLTQGIFHLLALAGLAPQVHQCYRTQQPLLPQFADPQWRAGLNIAAGGVVLWPRTPQTRTKPGAIAAADQPSPAPATGIKTIASPIIREPELDPEVSPQDSTPLLPLTALELQCLQSLALAELPPVTPVPIPQAAITGTPQAAITQAPITGTPQAPTAAIAPLPPPFQGFPQLSHQTDRPPHSPPHSPPQSQTVSGLAPDRPDDRPDDRPVDHPIQTPLAPRTLDSGDQLGSSSSTVNKAVTTGDGRFPAAHPEPYPDAASTTLVWLTIERILRQYTQHHFDRPIRSAKLMDTCFLSPEP
ncbi:DNA repair protein RecO [Prochlorothrix hollandica]|uniref:DNA repair protein RecO n=1 Tax=Prochlorothrix hollandica TaxID=1223 RepID=UPI00034C1307|nr:DNA repair protein RecO [Prochlorothrix hollandica]